MATTELLERIKLICTNLSNLVGANILNNLRLAFDYMRTVGGNGVLTGPHLIRELMKSIPRMAAALPTAAAEAAGDLWSTLKNRMAAVFSAIRPGTECTSVALIRRDMDSTLRVVQTAGINQISTNGSGKVGLIEVASSSANTIRPTFSTLLGTAMRRGIYLGFLIGVGYAVYRVLVWRRRLLNEARAARSLMIPDNLEELFPPGNLDPLGTYRSVRWPPAPLGLREELRSRLRDRISGFGDAPAEEIRRDEGLYYGFEGPFVRLDAEHSLDHDLPASNNERDYRPLYRRSELDRLNEESANRPSTSAAECDRVIPEKNSPSDDQVRAVGDQVLLVQAAPDSAARAAAPVVVPAQVGTSPLTIENVRSIDKGREGSSKEPPELKSTSSKRARRRARKRAEREAGAKRQEMEVAAADSVSNIAESTTVSESGTSPPSGSSSQAPEPSAPPPVLKPSSAYDWDMKGWTRAQQLWIASSPEQRRIQLALWIARSIRTYKGGYLYPFNEASNQVVRRQASVKMIERGVKPSHQSELMETIVAMVFTPTDMEETALRMMERQHVAQLSPWSQLKWYGRELLERVLGTDCNLSRRALRLTTPF